LGRGGPRADGDGLRIAGLGSGCDQGGARCHLCRGELGHELRVLGEALVRAAPAEIARHGGARRKDPVDPARGALSRREHGQPLDELGVACASEADVMREEGGALEVHLAVSLPISSGTPACVAHAARCSASPCSHHASGVFGLGKAPPPPNTEPNARRVTSSTSSSRSGRSDEHPGNRLTTISMRRPSHGTLAHPRGRGRIVRQSTCHICPSFSSSDMPRSVASIRDSSTASKEGFGSAAPMIAAGPQVNSGTANTTPTQRQHDANTTPTQWLG